jgi:hypothetical protein
MLERAGHTEPEIVVPVRCVVPVAVGRAEVLWIVVPGTAAEDAARGDDAGTLAACTKACRREQAEGSEAATIIIADPATSRVQGAKKVANPLRG